MRGESKESTGPSRVTRYQRVLPHWRASEAVYHVVWRLHRGQPALTEEERAAVVRALQHFDGVRYRLLAHAAMDDHVHAVVQVERGHTLERVVHSWKSFLAHRFTGLGGRRAPVWQREYYDRIVRSEQELADTLEYVRHNPTERWPDRDGPTYAGVSDDVEP